ncbi:MAG: PGPGW domain-containing protein [Pirellulales bacterium]
MAGWLADILSLLELTWSDLAWGLLVFVVTSVGGLLLVGFLLTRLPATYFCSSRPRGFWVNGHPLLRWTGLILKNIAGVLIVILGIVLSMPALPGPGILTILIGVLLLDFPGKRRLERWLVSRRRVLNSINRLRRKYGKPPLVLEDGFESDRVPADDEGQDRGCGASAPPPAHQQDSIPAIPSGPRTG